EELCPRQVTRILQEVSQDEARPVVLGAVLGGAEQGLDRRRGERSCAVIGKLQQRLGRGSSGFAQRCSDGERKSKASPRARGPAFCRERARSQQLRPWHLILTR